MNIDKIVFNLLMSSEKGVFKMNASKHLLNEINLLDVELLQNEL